MKHPRVRFTVRRMMVTVAGIALVILLTLDELRYQTRETRLYRRNYHAQEEEHYGGRSKYYPNSAANPRRAAYHARMKWKWDAAASAPWLPVEPDSPPPKP